MSPTATNPSEQAKAAADVFGYRALVTLRRELCCPDGSMAAAVWGTLHGFSMKYQFGKRPRYAATKALMVTIGEGDGKVVLPANMIMYVIESALPPDRNTQELIYIPPSDHPDAQPFTKPLSGKDEASFAAAGDPAESATAFSEPAAHAQPVSELAAHLVPESGVVLTADQEKHIGLLLKDSTVV